MLGLGSIQSFESHASVVCSSHNHVIGKKRSISVSLAGWLSVRTFVGRNRMNAGTIMVYCKQALSRKRVSQATIKDLYYEC